MTFRRTLYDDGGFVFDHHIWKMTQPLRMIGSKMIVFVREQRNYTALVYADHDCTTQLGVAQRSQRLSV